VSIRVICVHERNGSRQIFSRFSFAIEVEMEEMSTSLKAPNNQIDFGQMTK